MEAEPPVVSFKLFIHSQNLSSRVGKLSRSRAGLDFNRSHAVKQQTRLSKGNRDKFYRSNDCNGHIGNRKGLNICYMTPRVYYCFVPNLLASNETTVEALDRCERKKQTVTAISYFPHKPYDATTKR